MAEVKLNNACMLSFDLRERIFSGIIFHLPDCDQHHGVRKADMALYIYVHVFESKIKLYISIIVKHNFPENVH